MLQTGKTRSQSIQHYKYSLDLDGSNLPAFSAPSEKALAFIHGSSVFCRPSLVGAHRFLRPNMTMNRDQNLEHEGINEDDVFNAEIRKQVLLLTEDEDCV